MRNLPVCGCGVGARFLPCDVACCCCCCCVSCLAALPGCGDGKSGVSCRSCVPGLLQYACLPACLSASLSVSVCVQRASERAPAASCQLQCRASLPAAPAVSQSLPPPAHTELLHASSLPPSAEAPFCQKEAGKAAVHEMDLQAGRQAGSRPAPPSTPFQIQYWAPLAKGNSLAWCKA